ncbi:hypothetical protein GUJ93_ZPchr0003g16783 [Zizania palustris]|uniref:Uncharacterized protein n=1 Tax=Zizania palustris TaxID=103762 RepID=A0A8J5SVD7_ZIZPA|nr:hypothetical protein GUJ93_ZPchr0003g16783 [Zizania palustris]
MPITMRYVKPNTSILVVHGLSMVSGYFVLEMFSSSRLRHQKLPHLLYHQPGIGGEEVPHQDNTFGIPLYRASIMHSVAFGQFLDHIKMV